MQKWLSGLLFCAVQLVLSSAATADNLQPIPPLTGPVIDLTGTLSADQQQALSQKLISFHDKYGAQMQVLIIPTSAPEDAFTYSMRVVDKWKLGDAKKDDGLLLFIAKNDHRSQIQVGYGLEGTIPDVIASRMLNDVMAPYFKQGDFYGGIDAVINGVYEKISGDASLAPVVPAKNQSGQISNNIIVLAFIAFILLQILKLIMGPLVSAAICGPLLFFIAWLVIGIPVLMAFIAVLFLLLFSLMPSGRGYRSGYGGGLGGGGFGGGGWSGGGGGFGGGGAGGSW